MQQMTVSTDPSVKSRWICTAEYHQIFCRAARITLVPRRLLEILQLIFQEMSATFNEERVWRRLNLYNRRADPMRQWTTDVQGHVIFDRRKGDASALYFGLFVTQVSNMGRRGYQSLSMLLPPMWTHEGLVCRQYGTKPSLFSPQGICIVCMCAKSKRLHVIYRPFIHRQNIVAIYFAGRKFISFPCYFWIKQSLPEITSSEGSIPSVM